jgi:NAD(P)-dependent dehydrogenase (short-subunit alcohol dehydrogenase family)
MMATTSDLRGHAALITGAGRRLGRAFAEGLARRGADIAVHFSGSREGAEETVHAIRELGVRAEAVQADLGNCDQAARLMERCVAALGPIDWLVNNASVFEPLGALDCTPEDWQRHLDVNLTAPFLLSQAFARHRAGRPGVIVNLLDWRALRPGADHFPYTISKAALAAMTRSLALALAPAIRVNGLALGAILPPPDAQGSGENPPPGAPIDRWGTIDEVVQALLFLLTGPNFITGEILHLDGGRHLA